jgi:hypothetical protein
VRAVWSFQREPPKREYIVLQAAMLTADHPAVVAHPVDEGESIGGVFRSGPQP